MKIPKKPDTSPKNARGPLKRVASSDFATAAEFLSAAAFLVVPENQTQRQAFRDLMPQLFVLRSKGVSFEELANLLRRCGLNLQTSGVRRYYEDMLPDCKESCQAQLEEHLKQQAELAQR